MNTEISLVKLISFSRELEECWFRVRIERQQLMEVRANLKRIDEEAIAIVVFQLGRQIEKLEQEEKNLQKLKVALKRIISTYEQCEEKILDFGEKDNWIAKAVILNTDRYMKVLNAIPNINFLYGSE